jgi:transketolase
MTNEQLDQLSINTIRTLSIDAVQQANSGHPGTPMALAPMVYTIWNRVLRFDPEDPIWPDRDRFVLSNGHASTKAVNADYERLGQPAVSLDDIRRFRQLDSRAPGHPEYHWVSGVETTTGPLGRALPPAWAWRSRRSGLPSAIIDRDSTFSTTAFMSSAATVASWRESRPRLPPCPATSA